MTDSNRPARAPDVYVELFDDESVLYDERGGQVHHLNSTATLVWGLIDGERTVARILEHLGGTDPGSARAVEVDRIVAEFTQLGLIRCGDDPLS